MAFKVVREPRYNFGNEYDRLSPIFGDIGELSPDVVEALESRGVSVEDWATIYVKRFKDDIVELWVSKYSKTPNSEGFTRVL